MTHSLIMNLQNTVNGLVQKVLSLQNATSFNQAAIHSLNAQYSIISSNIATLNSTVTKNTNDITDLKAQQANLQSAFTAISGSSSPNGTNALNLETIALRLASLENNTNNSFESVRSDFSGITARFDARLSAIGYNVTALQVDMASTQSSLSSLESRANDTQSSLVDVHMQLTNLTSIVGGHAAVLEPIIGADSREELCAEYPDLDLCV